MPATRERLTRERVLKAALSIVDAEGLSAVSMRRLGEVLGVEAMSLYHHVPSKAAILDGIFEIVLSELPSPRRSSSWGATIRARAKSLRAVLCAHPNALPLFATRPAVTPQSIAHVEGVLAVLGDAGFSTRDAVTTMQVLMAYVVGHTVATCAPETADDSRPVYAELDDAEFAHVRAAAAVIADRDVEKEFAIGLDALLAGLEQRFGAR